MEDYLSQLRQMKKMGGMEGVLSMLPGVSKIKKQNNSPRVCSFFFFKKKLLNGIFFVLNILKLIFDYLQFQLQ